MSKFRQDDHKELPPISTASLPDVVFMLLVHPFKDVHKS